MAKIVVISVKKIQRYYFCNISEFLTAAYRFLLQHQKCPKIPSFSPAGSMAE